MCVCLCVRTLQSEANVQNLIVSNPAIGVENYGLTEKGKNQARQAAENLRRLLVSEDGNISARVLVVSSDFKRTRETAEIIHSELRVMSPLRFETGLRERRFGEFDMTCDQNYNVVVKQDASDPTHASNGCESVVSVVRRISGVVQELDSEAEKMIYILVSHGDPLCLLSMAFLGLPPNERIKSPMLDNGGVMELKERSS